MHSTKMEKPEMINTPLLVASFANATMIAKAKEARQRLIIPPRDRVMKMEPEIKNTDSPKRI